MLNRFVCGGVDMRTIFQEQFLITRTGNQVQFLWMLITQAFRAPDSGATKDRNLRS